MEKDAPARTWQGDSPNWMRERERAGEREKEIEREGERQKLLMRVSKKTFARGDGGDKVREKDRGIFIIGRVRQRQRQIKESLWLYFEH